MNGLPKDAGGPWDGRTNRFAVEGRQHAYRYVSRDLVEVAGDEAFEAFVGAVVATWPPGGSYRPPREAPHPPYPNPGINPTASRAASP